MGTDINWELLKFKHTIMGVSLAELQEEYRVSPTLMQFQTQNWEQLPLAQRPGLDMKDFKSLNEVSDEFKQQVKEETRVMSIIKQKYVGPKYVALEMALLTKALKLAENIDAEDKTSANAIRTLSTVLEDLLKHNNILNQDKTEEPDDNSGTKVWEVRIVEAEPKTPSTS